MLKTPRGSQVGRTLDAGVAEMKERLRDKRGRQARTRKLPS
jgi:hypothetical protein